MLMEYRDLRNVLANLTDQQLDLLVCCISSETGKPCPVAKVHLFKDLPQERQAELKDVLLPDQPVLMVVHMR